MRVGAFYFRAARNSAAGEPGGVSVVRRRGRKPTEPSDWLNCSAHLEGPAVKTARRRSRVRSIKNVSLLRRSGGGVSVAVVVGFEGPLGGEAQVLGLLVRQLGQLHPQLVQVGRGDLLVQLGGGESGSVTSDHHLVLSIQVGPTPGRPDSKNSLDQRWVVSQPEGPRWF